jgi:hypothetical protein
MTKCALLAAVLATAYLSTYPAKAQEEKCDPKLFMDNLYHNTHNIRKLYYSRYVNEQEFKEKNSSGAWDFEIPYLDIQASGNFNTFQQQRRTLEDSLQWSDQSDNYSLGIKNAWGVIGAKAYEACLGANKYPGAIRLSVDEGFNAFDTSFILNVKYDPSNGDIQRHKITVQAVDGGTAALLTGEDDRISIGGGKAYIVRRDTSKKLIISVFLDLGSPDTFTLPPAPRRLEKRMITANWTTGQFQHFHGNICFPSADEKFGDRMIPKGSVLIPGTGNVTKQFTWNNKEVNNVTNDNVQNADPIDGHICYKVDVDVTSRSCATCAANSGATGEISAWLISPVQ